jgi:translation initiation factor 6
MNFAKGTIKNSPYMGVFATVTDEVAIVPFSITEKEEKTIEKTLEVEVIKASIGETAMIGILAKGLGKKIAVSSLAENHEIKALEHKGIEAIKIDAGGFTSTGNLICMNYKAGIASQLLGKKNIEKISKFFKIKFKTRTIAGSELVGAAATVTNKGFICNPNIKPKEFKELQKIFGTHGKPTTANFGDLFVGNSVIANSKGAIAGENTSGIEMLKIDEGLRGD